MKSIILLFTSLLASVTLAGTLPINVDTSNGHVKQAVPGAGSTPIGAPSNPFNFSDARVTRLPHSVTFFVDGSGTVLTSGAKNPIKIPYTGTLLGWTMMCKPSGSVTVDIFRSANSGGLPTTSIVGSGTKPAISSGVENSSTSFTNWTSTTLTAKDNLAISLSGISSATYVELTLYFQ